MTRQIDMRKINSHVHFIIWSIYKIPSHSYFFGTVFWHRIGGVVLGQWFWSVLVIFLFWRFSCSGCRFVLVRTSFYFFGSIQLFQMHSIEIDLICFSKSSKTSNIWNAHINFIVCPFVYLYPSKTFLKFLPSYWIYIFHFYIPIAILNSNWKLPKEHFIHWLI